MDEEGWTHVIDRAQRAPKIQNKNAANSLSRTGDYEVDGVPYIKRNLDEVQREYIYWQKQWDESSACTELRNKLVSIIEKNTKCEIRNIVVLGIGSLLSARREARRCSATQLAAVRTMLQVLNDSASVIVQDPQYVKMDNEFLSHLGWTTVENPKAFEMIGLNSLVFAVHCYQNLYCTIARGCKPAILVGTKFERFEMLEYGSQNLSSNLSLLKCMYKEYSDEMDFPQMRHDFSDTKIYWRKAAMQ